MTVHTGRSSALCFSGLTLMMCAWKFPRFLLRGRGRHTIRRHAVRSDFAILGIGERPAFACSSPAGVGHSCQSSSRQPSLRLSAVWQIIVRGETHVSATEAPHKLQRVRHTPSGVGPRMTPQPRRCGDQVATAIDVSIDPVMNDASLEARQAITFGCSSALARRRSAGEPRKRPLPPPGRAASPRSWMFIERGTGTVDPASE